MYLYFPALFMPIGNKARRILPSPELTSASILYIVKYVLASKMHKAEVITFAAVVTAAAVAVCLTSSHSFSSAKGKLRRQP